MRGPTATDGAKREGGRKLSTGEESCQKPETSFRDADPRQGGGGWTSNRVQGTINNRKPEGTIFSVLLLTWTGQFSINAVSLR